MVIDLAVKDEVERRCRKNETVRGEKTEERMWKREDGGGRRRRKEERG